MSCDTSKMTLDEQSILDDNIKYVYGVLELLLCAISSDNPIDDAVFPVIMDAQSRIKKIQEAVDALTAA